MSSLADLKITGREVTQTYIDEEVLLRVKSENEFNFGLNYGVFPKDEPKDFIFKLKKVSKITDAMSGPITGKGYFVNQKIISVFSKFDLGEYKYYTPVIRLEKTGKFLDGYQWFHLGKNEIIDGIDFEKSSFFTTYVTFRKDPIKIKDSAHFKEILESLELGWGIKFETIYLTENYSVPYDMFTLGLDDVDMYATETLKNAIEEANIVGFEFEEASIYHQ